MLVSHVADRIRELNMLKKYLFWGAEEPMFQPSQSAAVTHQIHVCASTAPGENKWPGEQKGNTMPAEAITAIEYLLVI